MAPAFEAVHSCQERILAERATPVPWGRFRREFHSRQEYPRSDGAAQEYRRSDHAAQEYPRSDHAAGPRLDVDAPRARTRAMPRRREHDPVPRRDAATPRVSSVDSP